MKNKIYFLFTLIFTTIVTIAQNKQPNELEHKQSELTLKVGLDQGYFKDLQVGRLHYQQIGLVYDIVFSRKKHKSIFNARLDYHNIKAKTDASEYFTLTGNHVGNLSIEYLRRIRNTSQKWIFYIGPQFKSSFSYFNWGGQDSFTFLINHSLGAVFHTDYQLSEKHSLHSTLSTSLFNLLVRPPWAGYDFELETNLDKPLKLITNGDFTSINRYRAIDWFFNYRNQVSEKWVLNLQYRFQYQLLTGARQVNFMQNQYSLGLTKTF